MDWPGQTTTGSIVIGLVNNTSDRALKTTERQFLSLLQASSPNTHIRLRLFTCPGIARSIQPRSATGEPYSDIAALPHTPLDALIVTGMEPQARKLQDEPIYGNLAQIADWAEEHTIPVIWSCLAAHVVVLHLDGMARIRLPEKLSGVFECEAIATDHRLLHGLPQHWASPHSRYHGLPEDRLIETGYQILSRSPEVGVDIFTRHRTAPFLFLQGHPEYDPDTLLQEYRRDVWRHLANKHYAYPSIPSLSDAHIETELALIKDRPGDTLASLDAIIRTNRTAEKPCPWRRPSAQLVANWLNRTVPNHVPSNHLMAAEDRMVPVQ